MASLTCHCIASLSCSQAFCMVNSKRNWLAHCCQCVVPKQHRTTPSKTGEFRALELCNLQRNLLSREMPSQVGSLSLLQELHLDSNDLKGAVPTELCELPNQTTLFMPDKHTQCCWSCMPLVEWSTPLILSPSHGTKQHLQERFLRSFSNRRRWSCWIRPVSSFMDQSPVFLAIWLTWTCCAWVALLVGTMHLHLDGWRIQNGSSFTKMMRQLIRGFVIVILQHALSTNKHFLFDAGPTGPVFLIGAWPFEKNGFVSPWGQWLVHFHSFWAWSAKNNEFGITLWEQHHWKTSLRSRIVGKCGTFEC